MLETNGNEPWSYKLAWASTVTGFIFLILHMFTKSELMKETLIFIGTGIVLWTFHWLRWTKAGNTAWKNLAKPTASKSSTLLLNQSSKTVTKTKTVLVSKKTQDKVMKSLDEMIKKLPVMPTIAVIMIAFLVFTAYSQGNWLQLLMVIAGCVVYGLYHFNKMDDAWKLLIKNWKEVWLGVSILGLVLSFTLGFAWGGFLLSTILSAITVFDGWGKVGEGILTVFKMNPLLFSGGLMFGLAITNHYNNMIPEGASLMVGEMGYLCIFLGILYAIKKAKEKK